MFAANGLYPEPEHSSYIIPLQFFKMHFNAIPPPMPRPFSDQNFVRISHLSHEWYMDWFLVVLIIMTMSG
jgi:hypothetical protein